RWSAGASAPGPLAASRSSHPHRSADIGGGGLPSVPPQKRARADRTRRCSAGLVRRDPSKISPPKIWR
ncbi:MAG: hypothetical protein NUK54_09455, partial [Methanothrix sp.]|nr:hypothetical protein [Methanothrix sp.]